MVQFEVTAQLVQGTGTLTQNGVSTVVSVDTAISFTSTQATLVEAKQKARESVNLQAATILQEKLVAAGFSPENASLFYKGRVAVDVSLWMKVNITNVQIIQ
jgi:hypothetical protein